MSAAKRNLFSPAVKKSWNRCQLSHQKSRIHRLSNLFIDYQTYLHRGYPIGIGVIEEICWYLVKDWMDINWGSKGLEGAEAILKLRSLIKSNDFEDYWKFHLKREFYRNYASKYQDIIVQVIWIDTFQPNICYNVKRNLNVPMWTQNGYY